MTATLQSAEQAVMALTRMGYTAVTNIGGISSYHGEVEK